MRLTLQDGNALPLAVLAPKAHAVWVISLNSGLEPGLHCLSPRGLSCRVRSSPGNSAVNSSCMLLPMHQDISLVLSEAAIVSYLWPNHLSYKSGFAFHKTQQTMAQGLSCRKMYSVNQVSNEQDYATSSLLYS